MFLKALLTITTVFFVVSSAVAQINFKKFKENLKEAVNDFAGTEEETQQSNEASAPSTPATYGGVEFRDNRMLDFRTEQLEKDTSFYNYIFSQGNRASFFANRDSKENLWVSMAKSYEDESVNAIQLEVFEQAFDLNRSGEFSMYINASAASLSFLEALALLTSNYSYGENVMQEVLDVTSLVDMDTLNIPEKYALGKTIANIAILVHANGDYRLAEEYINSATKYFKEEIGGRCMALASLYNNLAVSAQAQGKYTDAENFFAQSEEVIRFHGKNQSLSHAIITSNRALLYNEIGQYKEAKKAIREAIDMASGAIREKGRDNVSFKINQGLIYYSSGDYEQAEQIFNEVLVLKRRRMAKGQTDYANVENYLASVLMEEGKYDEVRPLLDDARGIFRRKLGTSHPAYLKCKYNLGRYHLTTGNFAEAENVFRDVNSKYLTFFGEHHPDYLSSLEDLAVVSWKQGHIAEAKEQFEKVLSSNLTLVEQYFGAMSEYEKGQYWAKVRPSILKFFAFAVDQADQDPSLLTQMYNLHLKTKGILLSASTRVREEILNSNDEQLKSLYQEWVSTKEHLIHYYSYSKAKLDEQKVDLDALESKANQLEKELSRRSSSFAQSNKLPTTTLKEVKDAMSATDAAVEVVGYPVFDTSFGGGKQYAFLIAKPAQLHPSLVVLENGEELDGKYAKAYLNMVKLKTRDAITYAKFWKPVDEKLVGCQNVHLSLDGIYFQVNIGALQKPDGMFVSDAFDLHLYSSTRDLVNTKAGSVAPKEAVFFGYPDYGGKQLLTALPGTKAEVEAVSHITKSKGFSAKTYMQERASEENFKNVRSPSLLHVATHGFFLPESKATGEKIFGVEVTQAKDNPLLRSGLMLANAEQTMQQATEGTEVSTANNGVLTAYEVLTLDLKSTDLVVLSACETGLGEIRSGEGVYGLQRAFQVAGARSVIMSLWKVSDEATMQLMTKFYEEWMGGKSKEEAFFAAQKSLRSSFAEPYYWGAFVMLN